MAAVLFGSLSLAARSWDGGEAKAGDVSRCARRRRSCASSSTAEFPLRVEEGAELPLMFAGERDEIRYAAALPPRVPEGGAYFFRLAVAQDGRQVAARAGAHDSRSGGDAESRVHRDAERSVLADGIAELTISYFGRDANADRRRRADAGATAGTTRSGCRCWCAIDVKPREGPAVAAARRRAAARARSRRARRTTRRATAAWGRADAARIRLRRARQHGIALIAVLWLTVLLTVIASGFAFSMRSEALAARNALSLAQARAAADGAVERDGLRADAPAQPARRLAGRRRAAHVAGRRSRASRPGRVDESARIDLNTAQRSAAEGPAAERRRARCRRRPTACSRAILDWRDPDDLKRPNGAEEADYRAAGLKYKPANAPFETVGELRACWA